jgi:hypothetical protein
MYKLSVSACMYQFPCETPGAKETQAGQYTRRGAQQPPLHDMAKDLYFAESLKAAV